jgi:hypothetical protein
MVVVVMSTGTARAAVTTTSTAVAPVSMSAAESVGYEHVMSEVLFLFRSQKGDEI